MDWYHQNGMWVWIRDLLEYGTLTSQVTLSYFCLYLCQNNASSFCSLIKPYFLILTYILNSLVIIILYSKRDLIAWNLTFLIIRGFDLDADRPWTRRDRRPVSAANCARRLFAYRPLLHRYYCLWSIDTEASRHTWWWSDDLAKTARTQGLTCYLSRQGEALFESP